MPCTVTARDAEAAVRQVRDAFLSLRDEIGKIIVGQEEIVEQVLIAMFCRGHAVVVGVPGLAKTLLISTTAQTLNLAFSRIQFTPDLMPSDITGTEVIEEDKTTGSRNLRFVRGPVFANIVLADEINRTPPKTQAALLEAMQEHQVTAGGVQHRLPEPFFVLATQNPIEQEGTYPLPEAQLDRFMFMIRIGYPTADQELEVIRRTTTAHEAAVSHVMTGSDVQRIQQLVREVPVADHVLRYVLALVRATRVGDEAGMRSASVGSTATGQAEKPDIPPSGETTKPASSSGAERAANEFAREYLTWGAGPRASQYLVLAAKAKAILMGATHVQPQHVAAVVPPVLRHRLITNFNAEADSISSDDVIVKLLEMIPPDRFHSSMTKHMDAVMK